MVFNNDGFYAKILDNNKKWCAAKLNEDAGFIKKLTKGQTAPILWIGCTENHEPAYKAAGTTPGEVFVQPDVDNGAVDAHTNTQTVLDYAVNVLNVKHVIVCGHYDNDSKAVDSQSVNTIVEANIRRQVFDLAQTSIVQNAWKNGQELCVHGWVYGLDNGIVTDLEVTLCSNQDLARLGR